MRAGLGVGFAAHYLIRTDSDVLRLLPKLKIPPLPVWLAVHRKLRTSSRIWAAYDFLAQALPKAI